MAKCPIKVLIKIINPKVITQKITIISKAIQTISKDGINTQAITNIMSMDTMDTGIINNNTTSGKIIGIIQKEIKIRVGINTVKVKGIKIIVFIAIRPIISGHMKIIIGIKLKNGQNKKM